MIRPGGYEAVGIEAAAQTLATVLRAPIVELFHDQHTRELATHIDETLKSISSKPPFPLILSADLALARLCYALCRVTKPAVVVETGVAYGVTSAFILKASAVNRSGTLHSIDLPPIARKAERFIGMLVPEVLRSRWNLRLGPSKRHLPELLRDVGGIDAFVHDTLHTERNIRWELETVTPSLAQRAFVIVDDINANSAFSRWAVNVVNVQAPWWSAIRARENRALFGAAVFT